MNPERSPAVLIVSDFGQLAHSLSRGFLRAGCPKADVIDFYELYSRPLPQPVRSRYWERLLRPCLIWLANDRIKRRAAGAGYSLLLVIRGRWLRAGTLRELKSRDNSLLFQFNLDSPWDRHNTSHPIMESLPLFDCHFTWNRGLIQKHVDSGAKRTEYLPFGVDTSLHHPVLLSRADVARYHSDAVFVGTWEPERDLWLSSLCDSDLAIWGNRWEKSAPALRRRWRGEAVYGDAFCKAIAASGVALNLLRAQNKSSHNMRTFEVPACGGFLLTERSEGQAEFFVEGEEMACFSTPQELRDKTDYYLGNRPERDRIAQSGYRKALQPAYSFEARAAKVLATFFRLRGGQA